MIPFLKGWRNIAIAQTDGISQSQSQGTRLYWKSVEPKRESSSSSFDEAVDPVREIVLEFKCCWIFHDIFRINRNEKLSELPFFDTDNQINQLRIM